MKKFYRVSTPYFDRVEKKFLNIALKNNEISGFFGRFHWFAKMREFHAQT